MSTRPLEIVETLLDLTEDLNSKMPVLRQQFPEYEEADIQTMAQADPTSPQRADYITWLLRMRRAGIWDGNTEPVRTLLDTYNQIKRAQNFTGKRDINQYKSVEELQQDVEANKLAGSKAQRAEKGVKPIAKSGNLSMLQMLTPEACRKFAVGNGSVDQPQTRWCTIAIETAAGYLRSGPIYVIMKGRDPYVQVHFDLSNRGSTGQAKDIHDVEIKPDVAKQIAPLFTDPSFAEIWQNYTYRPTGWAVNDSHIEKQLVRLIKRWYNEQLQGYAHPRSGEFIQPKTTDVAVARETLREKLKSFFDLFASAVKAQDEQIIRQIGERHGAPGGIQAVFNGVYELQHPATIALPPLLQSYSAFEQRFNELAEQYERELARNR